MYNIYKRTSPPISIQKNRKTINRKIDQAIETNIMKELNIEKDLIKAKDTPICHKCPIYFLKFFTD